MAKFDKTRQGLTELSIEQQNAIDMLITGKSDRETAEVCGVSRQTVNGWKQQAEFIAELNKRRAALWEDNLDALRALVGEAVKVLADDLRQDADIKSRQWAAVHILKAVGLYGENWKPDGPTSALSVHLNNWDF